MYLVFYDGEHSIKIGEKDSWEDWHLIPASKPVIAPPTVKTKEVDIPGANGTIDLTSILTGFPTYGNRSGDLEFILSPDHWSWETAFSEITDYLHGRYYHLYLSDDPGYFYEGTFSINAYKSDAKLNSITIHYNLYPFKHEITNSIDDWLWDPFSFENGVIQNLKERTVDGTLTFTISNCTEPVSPTITVTAAMTMVHEYTNDEGPQEDTYQLSSGLNILDMVIAPGLNEFTVTGNGKITFVYRGGRL